jgi:hypothetical protein
MMDVILWASWSAFLRSRSATPTPAAGFEENAS